jgi:hypothetical protein
MIKPQELTIGSLVYVPAEDGQKRMDQIIALSENFACVDKLGSNDLNPIRISGSILEKFGFELGEDSVWNHNKIQFH